MTGEPADFEPLTVEPISRTRADVVAEDFGNCCGANPFLTGVVIDELDGDDFDDIGSGLGGVVTAMPGGAVFRAPIHATDGCTLRLAPGTDHVMLARVDTIRRPSGPST